jgi:hypothetical protein
VCIEVVAISGRAYVFNVVRFGGGVDATNMFGVFGWTPSVSDWLMVDALRARETTTCGEHLYHEHVHLVSLRWIT